MYKLSEKHIKEYLLGKRANFVLENKTNGHHAEFSISIKKDTEFSNRVVYNVFFKSNQSVYIGRITKEKILSNGENIIRYNFWELKPSHDNYKDYYDRSKLFSIFFRLIFYNNKIPNNVNVLYTGQCSICGRKLTNPTYIDIGIGPDCLANM